MYKINSELKDHENFTDHNFSQPQYFFFTSHNLQKLIQENINLQINNKQLLKQLVCSHLNNQDLIKKCQQQTLANILLTQENNSLRTANLQTRKLNIEKVSTDDSLNPTTPSNHLTPSTDHQVQPSTPPSITLVYENAKKKKKKKKRKRKNKKSTFNTQDPVANDLRNLTIMAKRWGLKHQI